jgi:serine beta-lactamase-like protein LACTB
LKNKSYPPGYLKAETVQAMWTAQPGTTRNWGRGDGYGMGWVVVPSRQEYGGGDVQAFAVGHTGGAVGASSVLLVVPHAAAIPSDSESARRTPSVTNSSVPSSLESVGPQSSDVSVPCGVTVAIITNLGDVGLHHLAMDVAALFCEIWSQIH